MRITRLKADGFGPLRGEHRFHPGRVALVVDRNETGKSSLLAAIVAALYGLEADRRTHKVLTPLERWRPWDGGSYRVELDLESEGETYTVKRDFERGTVEVWNERGLEVTASFREGKDEFPVGKKLLGLDADGVREVRAGATGRARPGRARRRARAPRQHAAGAARERRRHARRRHQLDRGGAGAAGARCVATTRTRSASSARSRTPSRASS